MTTKRSNGHRPYIRLTEPLVRENGTLRPASWDEALDRAAFGFRRTIDTFGPNAMGTFSCSKSTNEVNYLAGNLSRAVVVTQNIASATRT